MSAYIPEISELAGSNGQTVVLMSKKILDNAAEMIPHNVEVLLIKNIPKLWQFENYVGW